MYVIISSKTKGKKTYSISVGKFDTLCGIQFIFTLVKSSASKK